MVAYWNTHYYRLMDTVLELVLTEVVTQYASTDATLCLVELHRLRSVGLLMSQQPVTNEETHYIHAITHLEMLRKLCVQLELSIPRTGRSLLFWYPQTIMATLDRVTVPCDASDAQAVYTLMHATLSVLMAARSVCMPHLLTDAPAVWHAWLHAQGLTTDDVQHVRDAIDNARIAIDRQAGT